MHGVCHVGIHAIIYTTGHSLPGGDQSPGEVMGVPKFPIMFKRAVLNRSSPKMIAVSGFEDKSGSIVSQTDQFSLKK